MHIEVQVALNFVISYLYNKLPRRRVNLFGEELEKALKEKFQGHWYPEKPFKGSAFRCLKTGDPVDQVLEKAARESGVPITDILENLPAELSVWVDPGEVSYRIGEKGAVKILFSEHHDHSEDSSSADCEVTKTFNPEAQCFRPIDAVANGLNGINLSSPKTSPQGTSPTSSTSPTFKGNLNPSPNVAAGAFLPRTQAPITFTTATFAQTKFGSTKLKTNSKRTNSSYRMSPTEFSNYIKQRAMQQQLHHSHGPTNGTGPNHFGPIGQASPSRSLSPNPLGLGLQNDPFYFPTNLNGMGMYSHQFGNNSAAAVAAVAAATASVGPTNNHQSNNGSVGTRSLFDHFHSETNGLYPNGGNISIGSKFSSFIEPHGYYGMNNPQQQQHGPPPPPLPSQQLPQQLQSQKQQQQQQSSVPPNGVIGNNLNNNANNTINNNTNVANNNNNTSTSTIAAPSSSSSSASVVPQINSSNTNNLSMNSTANTGGPLNTINGSAANQQQQQQQQQQDTSKIMDGLNSFYSSTGPYQHLLVAN